MFTKHHSYEQTTSKLREAEVHLARGVTIPNLNESEKITSQKRSN
ncbi:hypothetical protein [Gimesia benthica]|nr:hypothetical protein [Gimesia benthica]